MYLSVVDALRCPSDHEESSLVLSADEWSGPRVLRGALGCPDCRARYAIANGIVRFVEEAGSDAGVDGPGDAERLAAQLGLSEPGGLVLLTGGYRRLASQVRDLCDVTLLLVGAGGPLPNGCTGLVVGDRMPLAANTLRAAALGSVRASSPAFLESVIQCSTAGARLVAPQATPLTPRLRLLARDDQEWVAEIAADTPTIPLVRARLQRRPGHPGAP